MTAALLARRPVAAPEPPREQATAGRTLPGRIGTWLAHGLVATAVLAFLGLAVGPHLLGYRTMTMLTASMAPAIEPGDVTVVTPVPVEDVREGMVLTYHIPVDDHRVVSHRVVSVQEDAAGRVTVQTKGDANDFVDPWQAALSGDTAWQVRAVVPQVGHLVHALRTPVVAQALVYGAPALLAGWLLMAIWRPAARPADEKARP